MDKSQRALLRIEVDIAFSEYQLAAEEFKSSEGMPSGIGDDGTLLRSQSIKKMDAALDRYTNALEEYNKSYSA